MVKYDTITHEIEFIPTINYDFKGITLAKGSEKDEIMSGFEKRNKELLTGEWKKGWHAFCESMRDYYTNPIKNACNEDSSYDYMKELIIRVLMVEPLMPPKEVYLLNYVKVFNTIVSKSNYYTCDAELLIVEDGVGILRNEEGPLLNLKGNRRIKNEIIAGTFIVVGIDENGNFKSLTDEQLSRYSNSFKEIEEYTDEEVNNAYWYELTCFLKD